MNPYGPTETVLVRRRLGAGQAVTKPPQTLSSAAQAVPIVGGVGGGILGGLTGAIVGMVTGHVAVGVGVGIATGAAAGYLVGRKIEGEVGTVTSTGGGSGPSGSSSGGGVPGGGLVQGMGTTIHPGAMQLTEAPGTKVVLILPSGASWAPQVMNPNGTAPTSGNAPYTVTTPNAVAGNTAVMISMRWTDSSGTPQVTTLTLVADTGVNQGGGGVPSGLQGYGAGVQLQSQRITLDPTNLQQTVTIPAGGTFSVDLPAGASWATQIPQAAAAGIPSSGNASASVQESANVSLVIAWNDVNAGAVKTTLTVTVS